MLGYWIKTMAASAFPAAVYAFFISYPWVEEELPHRLKGIVPMVAILKWVLVEPLGVFGSIAFVFFCGLLVGGFFAMGKPAHAR